MGRKFVNIIIFLVIIAGYSIPAIAAEKSGQKEEKPLWGIIADSFKDFKIREQDKIKGLDNVNIFQEISDGIKSSSDKAKDQSLRGK